MTLFDEFYDQLQQRTPPAPLFPRSTWDSALSQRIRAASDAELFGDIRDPNMAAACRAGLLLWNDDLHASHDICQGIETHTGSLWHAVMHRREGDASNSMYWWRKTGAHPAFDDIFTEAMSALENETSPEARAFQEKLHRAGAWNPVEFVRLCDADGNNAPDWVLRLQRAEFMALLQWNRDQV
jgi:hypothetical protein